MRNKSILAVFALCLGTTGRTASAQTSYEFHLVDAFTPNYGLRECYLYDINDHGTACGTATIQIGSGITYTGFHWTLQDGKTPDPISWPHGISDNNLMAGTSGIYDINAAQFTDAPLLSGMYRPLVLLDVNESGIAVGWVQICNCSNSQGVLQLAYAWDRNGSAFAVPVPDAKGIDRINRDGLMVGWTGGNSRPDSFVYDLATGSYTMMSTLFPGANIQTTAVDVNDNGVVVGARKVDNGLQTPAYIWSAGSAPQFLPLPPAEYQPHVRPSSINNAGVVVGSIYSQIATQYAFVYDAAHGIRNLNAISDVPAGFTLMAATRVNDAGWIVGYGYGNGGMYKAFVLTPVLPNTPGDLNCDGLVNNFDIDPFVLALSDAAAYAAQFPACNINNADVNHDGAINNFDIDPFASCLVAGCP